MDVDNQSLNAELISNWGLLRKVGTYLTWAVDGIALAMFALFVGEIAFKADDFVAIGFGHSSCWILIHDSELYVIQQRSPHWLWPQCACAFFDSSTYRVLVPFDSSSIPDSSNIYGSGFAGFQLINEKYSPSDWVWGAKWPLWSVVVAFGAATCLLSRWFPRRRPLTMKALGEAVFHPARWIPRRKPTPGFCFKCGYDLRASKDRCPECGTPISLDIARTRPPSAAAGSDSSSSNLSGER